MTKKRLMAALVPLLLCGGLKVHADTHAGFPLQDTPNTGGDGTVEQPDTNAYSLPQGNLSMTKRLDFSVGNSFFVILGLKRPPAPPRGTVWAHCSIPIRVRAAI